MILPMANPEPLILDDDSETEVRSLLQAVATAEADPRRVPHEQVRAWLLLLAHGQFDALAPKPR